MLIKMIDTAKLDEDMFSSNFPDSKGKKRKA